MPRKYRLYTLRKILSDDKTNNVLSSLFSSNRGTLCVRVSRISLSSVVREAYPRGKVSRNQVHFPLNHRTVSPDINRDG